MRLLFTILFYVLIYTVWLKRKTPQNIVIGGAAGALPPVIVYVVYFDKNTTSVNISDNKFKKLGAGTVFSRVMIDVNWQSGHTIL